MDYPKNSHGLETKATGYMLKIEATLILTSFAHSVG